MQVLAVYEKHKQQVFELQRNNNEMASEHELEARAKKHHAAAAHKHQTRVLGAWHRQSHLSASLKCLHYTLNPCKV
jgi:hypothetical protein